MLIVSTGHLVGPERAHTKGTGWLPGCQIAKATFKIYDEDAGQAWLVPINKYLPAIPMPEGTVICGVVIDSYWSE